MPALPELIKVGDCCVLQLATEQFLADCSGSVHLTDQTHAPGADSTATSKGIDAVLSLTAAERSKSATIHRQLLMVVQYKIALQPATDDVSLKQEVATLCNKSFAQDLRELHKRITINNPGMALLWAVNASATEALQSAVSSSPGAVVMPAEALVQLSPMLLKRSFLLAHPETKVARELHAQEAAADS